MEAAEAFLSSSFSNMGSPRVQEEPSRPQDLHKSSPRVIPEQERPSNSLKSSHEPQKGFEIPTTFALLINATCVLLLVIPILSPPFPKMNKMVFHRNSFKVQNFAGLEKILSLAVFPSFFFTKCS